MSRSFRASWRRYANSFPKETDDLETCKEAGDLSRIYRWPPRTTYSTECSGHRLNLRPGIRADTAYSFEELRVCHAGTQIRPSDGLCLNGTELILLRAVHCASCRALQ